MLAPDATLATEFWNVGGRKGQRKKIGSMLNDRKSVVLVLNDVKVKGTVEMDKCY